MVICGGMPPIGMIVLKRAGRACPLCPVTSDIHLLSYGECIIYLDAEIAHSALDLRMAE
jgi:hypothetical protein